MRCGLGITDHARARQGHGKVALQTARVRGAEVLYLGSFYHLGMFRVIIQLPCYSQFMSLAPGFVPDMLRLGSAPS